MVGSERKAILALVRPVANQIESLSIDGRITLLCGLLAQEMCNLPPSDRAAELDRVLDELPGILRASEDGMRQALAENARDEGNG